MNRPAASPDLLSFATPILINRFDRPARLRDSVAELDAAFAFPDSAEQHLHLLRPVLFESAAGFASPGFRSNLDAHLRAAIWARDQGCERVLVLEDDLSFSLDWPHHGAMLLSELGARPWHIASLGYLDSRGEAPTEPDEIPRHGRPERADVGWAEFRGRVDGAHAYFVHARAYDAWIAHLEAVAIGRPGDRLRGPMASDGAINTFAWVDPDHVRLLAVPNMVGTRPTRSDITPSTVDRLPVVASLAETVRRWRRQRYGARTTNFGG